MSKQDPLRSLFGIVLLSLITLPMQAAENLEELNLDAVFAANALESLDDKALACLNSFGLNLGEAAALFCDEFMQAIDGELLANYLASCNRLEQWRNNLVNSAPASSGSGSGTASASSTTTEPTEPSSAQAQLDLVLATELNCNDNALEERTEYVFSAFNTLRSGTLLTKSAEQSLELRIRELEFQRNQNASQQSLINNVNQQNIRSREVTEQQINQLQNELIRQQINRPPN